MSNTQYKRYRTSVFSVRLASMGSLGRVYGLLGRRVTQAFPGYLWVNVISVTRKDNGDVDVAFRVIVKLEDPVLHSQDCGRTLPLNLWIMDNLEGDREWEAK